MEFRLRYGSNELMLCEQDDMWHISIDMLAKMYQQSSEILTVFHENRKGVTENLHVKTSADGIIITF